MDDFGKQFQRFVLNTKNAIGSFPVIAANIAVNFFQDSFKKQAWVDRSATRWVKRKDQSRKNKGRAILVLTGRLKRSIRVKRATWSMVQVSSDVPYAKAHNEGVKGIQYVKPGKRQATRKARVKGSYGKLGDEIKKSRSNRILGARTNTKAFARKQNIPKRQFMGNSNALNNKIDREFARRIMKIAA